MELSDESIATIQGMLKCCHCSQVLKDPLCLMKCQHNLCTVCVQERFEACRPGDPAGIVCPQCELFCPKDCIRELPLVTEMVSYHNAILKKRAEQDAAKRKRLAALGLKQFPLHSAWKCLDCQLNLCNSCKRMHLVVPSLKDHRIVPLNQDDSFYSYCSKLHGDKPVKYYCIECEESPSHSHGGEATTTVKDDNKPVDKKPGAPMTRLELKLQDIKEEIRDFGRDLRRSDEPYDKRMELLDRSQKEKKALIEQEHISMVEALTRSKQNELDEIEAKQKAIAKKQTQLENIRDTTQAALARPHDASLFRELVQGGIMKTLKDVDGREKMPKFKLDVKKQEFNVNDAKQNKKQDKGLFGQFSLKTEENQMNGNVEKCEDHGGE